jgi:hypothetical protein
MEGNLCVMAMTSLPGKNLDLTADSGLHRTLTDAKEKYLADFPPRPATESPAHGRVQHDDLEVVTEQVLESEDQAARRLSEWAEAATAHENKCALEFVTARITMVVDSMSCDSVAKKLSKTPLVQESRKRLYIFDLSLDSGVDWTAIKRRRLNVFAGAGPGLDINETFV